MNLPLPHLWKPALATPHWRPARRAGQQLGQEVVDSRDPSYSRVVVEKLVGFGVGAMGGLLIRSLFNLIAPGIRESRDMALVEAGLSAALGGLSILMPFRSGTLAQATGSLSLLSGVLAGNALASAALPKRRTA